MTVKSWNSVVPFLLQQFLLSLLQLVFKRQSAWASPGYARALLVYAPVAYLFSFVEAGEPVSIVVNLAIFKGSMQQPLGIFVISLSNL